MKRAKTQQQAGIFLGTLAQAEAGPLSGFVEAPFVLVGALVGLLVLAVLVYYARRAARDRARDERGQEEAEAARSKAR